MGGGPAKSYTRSSQASALEVNWISLLAPAQSSFSAEGLLEGGLAEGLRKSYTPSSQISALKVDWAGAGRVAGASVRILHLAQSTFCAEG